MGKVEISYSQAVSSLSDNARQALIWLHEQASAIGYTGYVSAVGSKPDNYKCEFKRIKSQESLCILRVDGGKWSLRCKLLHIADYVQLVAGLDEKLRKGLLASKACTNDVSGCKGPIAFTAEGTAYSLCRHSMLFRAPRAEDIPCIWQLLEREAGYPLQ